MVTFLKGLHLKRTGYFNKANFCTEKIFFFLTFVFLPTLAFPFDDALVEIPKSFTRSSECNALLLRHLPDDADPRYLRKVQAPYYEYTLQELAKFERQVEEISRGPLYPYTAEYRERFTGKNGTFGISFDPQDGPQGTTEVRMWGDPSMVRSMEVSFYADPNPQGQTPLVHADMTFGEGLTWKCRFPGNMEGRWYQFRATFQHQPGKIITSQYGEPLPQEFFFEDITAYTTHPLYETSQVYYPPDPSLRPKAPEIKGPRKIIEIDLSNVRPKDVDSSLWGTMAALVLSPTMRQMIAPFDVIELLPLHQAEMVTAISSDPGRTPLGKDVVYLSTWGYMLKGFGISQRKGGVDSLIWGIDQLRLMGKLVYFDHVFQHTKNGDKVRQWLMRRPYQDCDFTGCGNNLDLREGTTPFLTMMQILYRDLKIIGAAGSRQDLWGAMPEATAIKMRDLVHSWGLRISGEPYGYNGAFWGLHYNPVRDARLWDHEGRDKLREVALRGGWAEDLRHLITGGSLKS
ncbi:MAG: hypothetical protein WCG27_07340, partial [Pseudomonadota bacterium]